MVRVLKGINDHTIRGAWIKLYDLIIPYDTSKMRLTVPWRQFMKDYNSERNKHRIIVRIVSSMFKRIVSDIIYKGTVFKFPMKNVKLMLYDDKITDWYKYSTMVNDCKLDYIKSEGYCEFVNVIVTNKNGVQIRTRVVHSVILRQYLEECANNGISRIGAEVTYKDYIDEAIKNNPDINPDDLKKAIIYTFKRIATILYRGCYFTLGPRSPFILKVGKLRETFDRDDVTRHLYKKFLAKEKVIYNARYQNMKNGGKAQQFTDKVGYFKIRFRTFEEQIADQLNDDYILFSRINVYRNEIYMRQKNECCVVFKIKEIDIPYNKPVGTFRDITIPTDQLEIIVYEKNSHQFVQRWFGNGLEPVNLT